MLLSFGMSVLLPSHHPQKAVKQEFRIMRACAGLRMKLNREAALSRIIQPLAAPVVGVTETQVRNPLHALRLHGITVVLSGNPGTNTIRHGLIGAAVAVLELIGFSARRQRTELMAEADAENREFPHQFPKLLDLEDILCRVTGAVLEHKSVRRHGKDFLRRSIVRQQRHTAAPLLQAADNVPLGTIVQKGHVIKCGMIGRAC